MKIKLLEDIHELDRHGESVGIKSSKKRNPAWGPSVVVHDQLVTSKESQFFDIRWIKGAIIEASDASGQKFIDAGKAEQVKE